jgi:hypothetical protein
MARIANRGSMMERAKLQSFLTHETHDPLSNKNHKNCTTSVKPESSFGKAPIFDIEHFTKLN